MTPAGFEFATAGRIVAGAGQKISRPAVPFVAVPTTAGTGAEVTANAVLAGPRRPAPRRVGPARGLCRRQ
jgi:alcohol dehydrogenase class IV